MEEDNMNETIETPITEEEIKEESFPETTVEDVAKQMKDNHVGCIPVCDNNKKK